MRSLTLRLSQVVPIAAAVVVLIGLSALTMSDYIARSSLADAQAIFRENADRAARVRELSILQKEIELDIVGTQESLTDISATRGLDGLDDGFALAKEANGALQEKIAAASALATALNIPELVEELESLLHQYARFYESGVAMAQIYVKDGPEGGNKLMSGFDAVAEEMQARVEATGGVVARLVESERVNTAERFAALQATADRNVMVIIVLGVVVASAGLALVGFIFLRLLRPLARATDAMKALADGDFEVELDNAGRRDEIGDLATAFAEFREKLQAGKQADAQREQALRDRQKAEQNARDEAIASERTMVVRIFGEAMASIAAKDLTYRVTADLPEAYATLANDFNNALRELSKTIESISAAADQINSGTGEILSAADDLARRAEQQAAAVEESAAAVEQVTGAVGSSTAMAEKTGHLVEKTRNDVEHSGEIVRNAIDAMGRIAKSSEDISLIIGVIDDIAFQTNLLALNAGVEAARAGDAGKGFAVVAQEVRELAQRSANAAKEIKVLITASGEDVKSGVSQVSNTGRELEAIVQGVREINDNVGTIVSSAREQSAALREINDAVGSVDKGTQQNAAMAEEATAAAHSLREEVVRINGMLSAFRTGGQASAPKAVPAAAAATAHPSPARALGRKVARAFQGGAARDTADWEEF